MITSFRYRERARAEPCSVKRRGSCSGCKQVLSSSRYLKQPPPFAECRKINSRRSIPPLRAITGTELQCDLLVAIRNPQWRPNRVLCRGSHRSGIGVNFLFSRPLRRRTLRCNRPYRPVGGFAFKLAASFASIRINPRGHRGRVGPCIIGDDETFCLRQLLGVQQLCCTYRFEAELTDRFTVGRACSLRNLRQIDIDVL